MQEQEEEKTIPELVEEVRAGKMPRRRFFKVLTALGISAAGAGAIAAVAATHPFAPAPASVAPLHNNNANQNQNLHLHDQHLSNQQQGNIDKLHHDYAEHAIVEDSMYATPFVGRAAILARKGVGMAAIPGLQINVTNRVAHGNQVFVEWVASGTHVGGLADFASGRSFSIPGVTVVVREHGQIVRESIYYDMAEVNRQLA